eukprot:458108-Ditylum_brightwellii.AAC.1
MAEHIAAGAVHVPNMFLLNCSQVRKALRSAACCCQSNSICAAVMNGVGGTGTGPGFLVRTNGVPPERARYQVGFMTRARCPWLPTPNVVATEAAFSIR